MKTILSLRFTVTMLAVTLIFSAISCEDNHSNIAENSTAAAKMSPNTTQTSAIYWVDDASLVNGAGASILRTPAGIRTTIMTSGLVPGHVYTVWVEGFNNPDACQYGIDGISNCGDDDLETAAGFMLYGGGHIVGESGIATFTSTVRAGDLRQCDEIFGMCGEGLTNIAGAEIQLWLRDHGPVVPGMLDMQLKTFAGGCTPESSFDLGKGPNSCYEPQFAVFTSPM